MAFWSSLGQTFFISLFSREIREALDLSHGDFGSYYALATIASAFTLLWLGKLADSIPVKRLSLLTLSCLCLASLFFATVSSLVALVIGIYFLRLWGQGMMSHVWQTAIARRYVKARGRGLALAGLGMTCAESIGPAIIVALLAFLEWRLIWVIMAAIAFVSLAPFLSPLTKRTDGQDGAGVTGTSQQIKEAESPAFTRADMFADPAFWMAIIWLVFVPSFTVTGLLFHQIYFAESKGISLLVWSANYGFYAAAALAGSLLSGLLVDKFTAHKVVSFAQLPVIGFSLALWLADGPVMLALFFMLFGLCSGMPNTALNALLAERYGTSFLGAIRSVTLPINVGASAAAPILMGLMIDQGASLGALMALLGIAGIISSGGAFLAFNLGVAGMPKRGTHA